MADLLIVVSFSAYPDGMLASFESGETVAIGDTVVRVTDMVTTVTPDLAAQWEAKGLVVTEDPVPDGSRRIEISVESDIDPHEA